MEEKDDIIGRIGQEKNNLSKSHKKIAEYMMDNYDKAAYMTAKEIGNECKVSEVTVVRFAAAMGYDGFPSLQKALAKYVALRLNSLERLDADYSNMTQAKVLECIMTADAKKIADTLLDIDTAAFENAVDSIMDAETIYVVGVRSCSALADFLSFYLNLMFHHVVNVSTSNTSELFEQMLRVGEKDVVIGISFPRYSMRTLKAMEFANNRMAKVITITDSRHSPISLYSSCNLYAKSSMVSIADSLVAPLSLINALIVSLSVKKKDTVIHNLEELEKIWDDYQIYTSDEINLLDDKLLEQLKGLV